MEDEKCLMRSTWQRRKKKRIVLLRSTAAMRACPPLGSATHAASRWKVRCGSATLIAARIGIGQRRLAEGAAMTDDKPKVCIQCRVRKAVAVLYRAGKRQPRCQPCIDARIKVERSVR